MTTFFHFPRRQLARERGISRSPVGQLARERGLLRPSVGQLACERCLLRPPVGQLACERSDPRNVRERTTYDGTDTLREVTRGFLRSVVGSSLASAVLSAVQVGQLARERSESPSVRERTAYDSTGELPRNLAGFLRIVRTITPDLPRPLR